MYLAKSEAFLDRLRAIISSIIFLYEVISESDQYPNNLSFSTKEGATPHFAVYKLFPSLSKSFISSKTFCS